MNNDDFEPRNTGSFFDEGAAELRRIWGWITDRYYNIKHGLENLVRWVPIVWGDRNWDPYHVYRILACKLRFQADSIEKYGIHKYKMRDVRQMRLCVALLERLMRDDYTVNNYWAKKADERFGKLTLGKNGIKRSGRVTDQDKKLSRFYSKKSMELAFRLQRQDLELFGKIFARHSHEWWD